VMELGRRYPDKDHLPVGMAVARGLEPGIVGVAADLFLQRSEDSEPRVHSCGSGRSR